MTMQRSLRGATNATWRSRGARKCPQQTKEAMTANSKEQGLARNRAERIERLQQKYGAAAIDNGMRLRPDDFLDEVEWRDRIDQHYTRSWLEFTYGGLFTRKGLDDRTRLLVS